MARNNDQLNQQNQKRELTKLKNRLTMEASTKNRVAWYTI